MGVMAVTGLSLIGIGCSGSPTTGPVPATATNTPTAIAQSPTLSPTPNATMNSEFFIAPPGVSDLEPVPGSNLSITVLYNETETYTTPYFIVGITPATNTTLICPAANQYLLVDSTSGSNGKNLMTSTTQDTTDPGNGWPGVGTLGTPAVLYIQVWNVTLPTTLPPGNYNIVVEENGFAVGCSSAYGTVPNTHRTITVSYPTSTPTFTSTSTTTPTATNTSTVMWTSTFTPTPTATGTPTSTNTNTPSLTSTPTMTATIPTGIFSGTPGVSNMTPSAGSNLSVTVIYNEPGTNDTPYFIVGITPASNTSLVCSTTNQFLLVDSTSGSNSTSPAISTTQDLTDAGTGWPGQVVGGTSNNPYTQIWTVTIPSTLPSGSYNLVVAENDNGVTDCPSGATAGEGATSSTYTTITIP